MWYHGGVIEDVSPPDEPLKAPADDDLIEGWFAMVIGLRAMIDRLHTTLRQEYGITSSQFEALGLLTTWGELSVRELGTGMLYSSGSTSNLVTQLVRRGLVQRVADRADGRVVRLRLTPRGAAMIDAALDGHKGRVIVSFGELVGEDREVVLRFARRVAEAERIADRRPARLRLRAVSEDTGASHQTPRSDR